jgi:hypothetical protein
MTPKEKAWDLFTKFNKDGLHQISSVINRHVRKEMIKQCILISVDEVLKYQPYDVYTIEQCDNVNNYWQEVKQEIEKL